MYKLVIPLYLICFVIYILFTRSPDYFDGEIVPAKMVYVHDPSSGAMVLEAEYSDGYKNYHAKVDYFFRHHKEGDRLDVIYEKKEAWHFGYQAREYTIWGYWIELEELFWSLIFLIITVQVAYAITKNPTPEALIEQLEYKETSKPKYD